MSNYPEQEIIFCTKFSQDKMKLSTKKYTNMPTYGITKSKVIALCHKDTSYGCQSNVQRSLKEQCKHESHHKDDGFTYEYSKHKLPFHLKWQITISIKIQTLNLANKMQA